MVQEKGVPIGPINSEIRKVQCSSLRYKSNDKNHNMKGICYVSLCIISASVSSKEFTDIQATI